MYADYTGPFFPYFQDFSHEVQQLVLEELFHPHQSPPSMMESSIISEYDVGGEVDLFKAPEPIFEEPITSLDPVIDPMAAAVSMISLADQGSMPPQDLKVGNFELLQIDVLFDEECKNDIFVNSSMDTHGTHLTDELITGIPVLASDVQTGGSLSCAMVPISANTMEPSFLDYSELDFGAAYGMRRAFSDGDIKSSNQWPGVNCCSSSFEDRQQKLSRYRIKKSKRNFGRKIKYACRKALADSQPRIRGRFAKIGDTFLYNNSAQCTRPEEDPQWPKRT